MTRATAVLLVSVAVWVSGCSTLPSSKAAVRGKEIDGVNYIDFPSERRGAWVVSDDLAGKVRICAEPFSDTGISTEQLISLAAKLPKSQGSADGSVQTISNLVELKGRTPAVLAMRDVMYRMCERRLASPDGQIPDDELAIYKEVVKIIGHFASADRADAEAKQAMIVESAPLASSRVRDAKEAQDRGMELLAQCKWKEAETAFSQAEAIYPSFQISYEYARALRVNKGRERDAILEIGSAYLPESIEKRLAACSQ